jgi:antitoxin (DNA-binding transcriptional repressor) of toxin-antitoxin stability system
MTMAMQLLTVSKSQLKSHLLEYLRKIELEKKPLIVTHVGKPVAKISPYQENPDAILASLRKSVISYNNPLQSVGENDWEQLQ